MGPFQYRLMGFKDPPTDFYTRPFYMKALQKAKAAGHDYCLGSKPVTKVQFNYVRDVFEMFKDKLKFFFSFNGKVFLFSLRYVNQWLEHLTGHQKFVHI